MTSIHTKSWLVLPWRKRELSPVSVGWTALGVNVMAAATYSSFAKYLSGPLSPQALLFLSQSVSALFILFSFGALPVMKEVCSIKRKSVWPLLYIGVANGFVAPFLWFLGLQYTTAVNATLFGNAEMIFLIFLAAAVLNEKFTRAHLLPMCIIGLGILTIALKGFTEGLNAQVGDLLLIAASLVYSTGSITFRKYLHHFHPQILLFLRALIGIGCFAVLSPFLPAPLVSNIHSFPAGLIPILLGFALISQFLNVFSFYIALDRLPVATVSLASNAATVLAILFASWFLSEPIHGYHFVGGSFIILGTLLLEMVGVQAKKHVRSHLHERHARRV